MLFFAPRRAVFINANIRMRFLNNIQESHLSRFFKTFLLRGHKKIVPLSGGPTYPGTQLSGIFSLSEEGKSKGNMKFVQLIQGPT